MTAHPADLFAREELSRLAAQHGLDVARGRLCRTSSRFCLGVEHGDYNGTDLFGVGTDRFLWLASKPNDRGRVRLVSANFEGDGVIEFTPGQPPPPRSLGDSWGRFPCGVDWVLHRAGLTTQRGFDAVVYGNIPGGGMSRSASLGINLMLACFAHNDLPRPDPTRLVDLTQAVENDYIGSPCGKLDMVMICHARAGMGTLYHPADGSVSHVPLGGDGTLRFVSLDTGTTRAGLERSTYPIRVQECAAAVAFLQQLAPIRSLADVREPELFARLEPQLRAFSPDLADRLVYVYEAQSRLPLLLDAWRRGDYAAVGSVFRLDGYGLRDRYRISGPELEAMCEVVREVPGVFGERMLGGGDKGASGALVAAEAVAAVRAAVGVGYPRRCPGLAGKWAVHECAMVDGVVELAGL
ncbi:MAG: hypothetical protein IT455_11275 [Planctomycetes bacterium]|nr:hypothetical protein [Planctomycetota bacterium]